MKKTTEKKTAKKTAKKPSTIKLIAVVVAVLLVALICAAGIYVNDYYRADAAAVQAISEPAAGVSVENGSEHALVFTPDNENNCHTGFIFYPGGKVEYTAYAPLMSKLAERGITCILVKMPCNLAIMDTGRADGLQEQYPEIQDWYIGGHSLGGVAASMYLSEHAESYSGLVLLGAYVSKDLTGTELKVLSIYGSNDGVMNRENYEESRGKLPAAFTEQIIEGGCHAYFGAYGEQEGDGAATISQEEQQTITAEIIAGWMSEGKS